MKVGNFMDNQKIDIDEILDNEAKVSDEEDIQEGTLSEEKIQIENDILERFADYEYIHSGKAMNERELLHFSSRNTVSMVLVAGPFESGKTTLLVMMYHLFREGLNKKLKFKSSYTIRGFCERSESLLLNSGNSKPEIDRTSRNAQDLFLNLELVNENNQANNLIFTDISGELFSDPDFLKELPDYLLDLKNIILVMDGEAMGDVNRRRSSIHDIKVMIDNLIRYRIINHNTKIQVVCTKMDKLNRRDDYIDCEKYIFQKYEELRAMYEEYVSQISFYKISALNLDENLESETLEQIIENCFEENSLQTEIREIRKRKLNRAFERFGLRE